MVFSDLNFSVKSLTKATLVHALSKRCQDTIEASGVPSGRKDTPGPRKREGHSWGSVVADALLRAATEAIMDGVWTIHTDFVEWTERVDGD